jgi:hypothetical protein
VARDSSPRVGPLTRSDLAMPRGAMPSDGDPETSRIVRVAPGLSSLSPERQSGGAIAEPLLFFIKPLPVIEFHWIS